MRDLTDLRAAVVGTGFIGVVHVDALRRLGVEVAGVVGSSPERARAKSGAGPAARAVRELRGDARRRSRRRRPSDDAEPAAPRAGAGGAGGRQARRLREAARDRLGASPRSSSSSRERSGLVHCTNFNIRFYPPVPGGPRARRGRRRRRRLERPRRLPPGLAAAATPTGTGGSSPTRAASCARSRDIGSHWLDLVQFVTGRCVEAGLRRPRDHSSRPAPRRSARSRRSPAARRRRARRHAR